MVFFESPSRFSLLLSMIFSESRRSLFGIML